MKFYIPYTKNSKEAEDIFESVKKFAVQQMGWTVSDRRIKSIQYNHDGKDFIAEIGKKEDRTGEEVLVILESTTYLVCTPNRGVLRGEPILVGKNEIYRVEDFE
jgi:hypothetical protein